MAERSRTRRFARWVVAHRAPVAAALLLATAFFAYPVVNAACDALGRPLPGARVRIGGDPNALLPEHAFLRAQRAFAGSFGGSSLVALVVRVDSGTIFRPEVLAAIHGITRELDGAGLAPEAPPYPVDHDRVRSLTHPSTRILSTAADGAVEQRLAVAQLPETQAEAESLRQQLRSRPPAGYARLVSEDERAALVSAGFVTERLAPRAVQEGVFAHVGAIAERWEARVPGLRVFASGGPMERGWVFAHAGEILALLAASLAAILLLLWLCFRRWHGVLVPAVTAGVTAVWGLGFAGWLGIRFDPLVLVIPLLITARAISHTVQMSERFFEDYALALPRLGDPGRARDEAAASAMGGLLVPGTLGVVTDAAGLLVILVTSVPQMRDLALFGAFWVAAIVVTVEVLQPVLLSLLPPPRDHRHVPPRFAQRFARFTAALATHRVGRWAVAGSSVALLVGCTAFAFSHASIGTRGAGSPLFWSGAPLQRRHGRGRRALRRRGCAGGLRRGRPTPRLYRSPAPIHAMDDLERTMARATPLGRLGLAGAARCAGLWRANHFGDPKWEYRAAPTPATVRALIFQLRQDGPPGALRPFLSDDGRRAQVSLYYPGSLAARRSMRHVAAARDFVRAHPLGRVTPAPRAGPRRSRGARGNDRDRWLDRLHYFARSDAAAAAATRCRVEALRRGGRAAAGARRAARRRPARLDRGVPQRRGRDRTSPGTPGDVDQWWESSGARRARAAGARGAPAGGRSRGRPRASGHRVVRPTGELDPRCGEGCWPAAAWGVLAAVNEEVERSHVANLSLIFAAIFGLHSLTYRSLVSGAILLLQLGVASVAGAGGAGPGAAWASTCTPCPCSRWGSASGSTTPSTSSTASARRPAAGGDDRRRHPPRGGAAPGAAVCITATTADPRPWLLVGLLGAALPGRDGRPAGGADGAEHAGRRAGRARLHGDPPPRPRSPLIRRRPRVAPSAGPR